MQMQIESSILLFSLCKLAGSFKMYSSVFKCTLKINFNQSDFPKVRYVRGEILENNLHNFKELQDKIQFDVQ